MGLGLGLGLRSTVLLTVFEVAAAGLGAGTVWLWPTLARRGAAMVALRLLLIGALQVSTLGLVFVWVNRSYEFYSSWSDLLGTNTSVGKIVSVPARALRAAGPAHARPGAGGGSGQVPAVPRSRLVKVLASYPVPVAGAPRARPGSLQTVRISGPLSGIAVRGAVYLPPGAAHARPSLPVVLVLTADPAGVMAAGPYGARQLAATAAAEIAARRLPSAMVAVLPTAIDGPASRACLDVPAGPQAETFFTQDLPQALEQAYHVATAPSRWAVVGGAGAGYCALQVATSPAGEFGLTVVPPGTYTAPPGGYGAGPGERQMGASTALRIQGNLLWRLQHLPRPAIQLLVAGPGQAVQLLAAAQAPMRTATVSLSPGATPLAPVFAWIGHALGGRP